MKRTLALPRSRSACLAAAAAAQDAAKLEAEAKSAFDSGRFKEAGEKYAAAAEAPGLPPTARRDLHLQSALGVLHRRQLQERARAAQVGARRASGPPGRRPTSTAPTSPTSPRPSAARSPERACPPSTSRSSSARPAPSSPTARPRTPLYDLKRAAESTDPEVFRILADAHDRLGPRRRGRRRAAARLGSREGPRQLGADRRARSTPRAPPPVAPAPVAPSAPLLESRGARPRLGRLPRRGRPSPGRPPRPIPKNAEAHRMLGDAALLGGQDGEAEREFTAAIVLDSGNAQGRARPRARVAEQQKKWNTAASHYRRALELNPRSVAAARGLGRSMSALGDKSAARIAFGRAIEIDPTSAEARNDFGVFLFRSDETGPRGRGADRGGPPGPAPARSTTRTWGAPSARRACSRRRSASSPRPRVSRPTRPRRGRPSARSARSSRSPTTRRPPSRRRSTSTRSARRRRPASPPSSPRAGKLPEAETALIKAIESNTKSPALWNNLGVIRTQRGDYPGALEAFSKALGARLRLRGRQGEPGPRDRARGPGEGRVVANAADPRAYAAEIEAWRERRLAGLTAPDGWLSVVGLTGSRTGENRIGSRLRAAVRCPPGGPRRDSASIVVSGGGVATLAGRRRRGGAGSPISRASVRFLDARRRSRFCADPPRRTVRRPRRADRGARRARSVSAAHPLASRSTPPGESRRASSRTTRPGGDPVANVRGHRRRGDLPGRGRLRARRRRAPARRDRRAGRDGLWIVFGDATNGRETYGGGRFVYAPPAGRRPHRHRLQQGLQPALRLHAVFDVPASAPAESAADPRRGGREDFDFRF